jgi:cell wall-associated NlpC family hydrolase
MTEPQQKPSLFRTLAGAAAAQGAKKAASAAGTAAVGAIGWPAILAIVAILVLVIAVLLVTCIVALKRMSDQRQMLNYQCESRLGYSVGNTASLAIVPRLATSVPVASAEPETTWETTELQPATTTPPTRTTNTTTASAAPTTTSTTTTTSGPPNPYATQTVPATANEKTKACATAVQSGDLVAAPLQRPGTTVGRQAAEVAHQQVGLQATAADGTLVGATNNAFSAANLVRYSYYQASRGATTLPETIADQISVGDRVDADAISPGDLVFFNFTPAGGPTAVMIAISPTLGVDATTLDEPIAVGVLPTGNIIVKRPRAEVPPA